MANTEILKLNQVTRTFLSAGRELTVVDHVDLRVAQGESLAIIGPSGSGKTTLLGLCSGLDVPSSGSIELAGRRLETLTEDERATLRNLEVGFVFQSFQLIPTLTALENVCLPLELRGIRRAEGVARNWLERVGLADRGHHYPVQLSGGEQQRVAIARAGAADPNILFADEPTGNLDDDTSQQIEDLLFAKHEAIGNTFILVTHDRKLAERCDRIVTIRSGRVEEIDRIATAAETER